MQFEIDISRAAWAVEAAMEWQKLRDEPMPEVLLQGLTRKLFEPVATNDEKNSSLDDLASTILGSAASAQIKVAGNEIILDRKSLRRMRNEGSMRNQSSISDT